MNTSLLPPPPEGDVVWAVVEDGFFVASRDDVFLGFVDRISHEVYQVCDAHAQQVGMLASRDAAMAYLVQHVEEARA